MQRLLGLICLCMIGGVLYAGLHPFHTPANAVSWIAGTNGVRFGEHATMLATGNFPRPAAHEGERSIEFWIQPGFVDDSNTLLALYSPAERRLLLVSQSLTDLKISIEGSSAWKYVKPEQFYIGDAFRDGKSAFWTVTFAGSGTSVYRDGVLIRHARLTPSPNELAGQLVVGNSPIFSSSWSGTLRGLAVYDVALTPAETSRHYRTWTRGAAPELLPEDNCVGLYLFDEHAGQVVHNRVGSGVDLAIPARFTVLRKTVLDPIWRAFNWQPGFWEDAFINVTGFMPFGCFFCAYFSARGAGKPVLYAVALGAAASLTIELGQVFLPTRDSSMADLIDNILGSALGALAYRGTAGRVIDRVLVKIAGVAHGGA